VVEGCGSVVEGGGCMIDRWHEGGGVWLRARGHVFEGHSGRYLREGLHG